MDWTTGLKPTDGFYREINNDSYYFCFSAYAENFVILFYGITLVFIIMGTIYKVRFWTKEC